MLGGKNLKSKIYKLVTSKQYIFFFKEKIHFQILKDVKKTYKNKSFTKPITKTVKMDTDSNSQL